MDTFTQIALGACIGQAIGYKKFGNKALIYGGLGGLIPDLDVFLTPFMGEFGGWKYHRHFTHALWFGPVVGGIMGWGLWRYYGRQMGHLWPWVAIMVLSILTHPLLDLFTIYGTQLLAPFSTQRFEISAVSIIDPIYTVILLLAMLMRELKPFRGRAQGLASAALLLTTAYLFYGWSINTKAEQIAMAQLEAQKIPYSDVRAFTTIFQPFLRRIVVRQGDEEIRAGFVSIFSPQPIKWGCTTQMDGRVQNAVLQTDEGQLFDWFSMGNLAFLKGDTPDTIIVSDARYGIPGKSLFGWWGQMYKISTDKSGNVTASYLSPFHFDRDSSWHNIKHLFRAAYGLDNDFLLKSDDGCYKSL